MKLKKMETLYSAEEIAKRVQEIGAQINNDYAGRDLVMICVLKGAFMFFSDLVKHVSLQPEIDFIRVASYGSSTTSSKTISFTKDVEISLEGKDVLLVEDVVDSGHTMKFLLHQLTARGAKYIRIASLVDKHERREVEVAVDYAGFTLNQGFILGYGLDYAEKYRELPAIYVAVLDDNS